MTSEKELALYPNIGKLESFRDRTCFSCFMSSRFMSAGLFTESNIGFTGGPEYGGPVILDPSGGAM
jgi:hypothetical protein